AVGIGKDIVHAAEHDRRIEITGEPDELLHDRSAKETALDVLLNIEKVLGECRLGGDDEVVLVGFDDAELFELAQGQLVLKLAPALAIGSAIAFELELLGDVGLEERDAEVDGVLASETFLQGREGR